MGTVSNKLDAMNWMQRRLSVSGVDHVIRVGEQTANWNRLEDPKVKKGMKRNQMDCFNLHPNRSKLNSKTPSKATLHQRV
jgi:hypothetical protein